MEAITFQPDTAALDGSVAHDLAEIDAAIALVARGTATRVCLVALHAPRTVAPIGLARAQAAGVDFSLDRAAMALTLGPKR
jgi:hypothetical protein